MNSLFFLPLQEKREKEHRKIRKQRTILKHNEFLLSFICLWFSCSGNEVIKSQNSKWENVKCNFCNFIAVIYIFTTSFKLAEDRFL